MKYILFIITFFICSVAEAQVKVLGYITPNAQSDTYPTHLDINGAGGFMAMNTLSERNAIPVLRRKKGMMVYVADSTKTYQLQNDLTTWLPFVSNGGESILQLASGTVLGGVKIGNDFTMGADSVLNISVFRKNLWNQIALLYQYSTTDSMLSKIDSATTAHDYIFNDTDFIWSGRYVLLRHRYSPQDSLFMASVAYNITQQDIDNWNASVDLSNFYNKSQVDSVIDSGFARHKYWFDGKTIKGEGTFPDPFHVDPFGDTTVVTYLNEHTYTTQQVDSAIAANYHIYGAGYGLILNNSTFILDTAALTQAFFLNSVANSITQEDIDRWNEAVDFSNFYTKSQVDSAFAAQALASRIYFDGVTIQGDGTALDPFHAVFGGDSGVANLYTRAQVDSAIAANYHIYGAGYGLLLQNSTFSVDTSVIHGGSGGSTIDTANRFISDVIGISSNTLRFIKGTGYFDVIIQNVGYTPAQVDSAIAANRGVTTFNGRTEAVVPQLSDYAAYYASLASLNSKPDSVGLKSSTTTDTLVNYYPGGITLAKGVIDRQDGLISGAYVTWSGTGLTYDVTAGVYYINGVRYTSPAGSITLNAAHSTLDRIDVIAVDNTGSIVSIQGTPSSTPTEPQVDPTSQIYLTSVYIPMGSTLPQGVVSNIIHDEHVSPDWTLSSIGMTADGDNTTAPYHGSKDISTGAWSNGSTVNFTGSTLISASSLAAFKIFIRLKSVMANSASITVRFFNGGTAVSKALSVANYGFNKASVGGYQNISIPISDFVVTGTFNKIQVQFGGSNSTGVYIDYIQFQSGTGTVTNVNTVSNVYKKTGTDSIFMSFPSKNVFAYKDSVGTGGGSGTVTSVGLSLPGVVFNSSVTGSPVTTSGTLAPTLATQSPYTLFGRASGTGTPSFLASIDSNWIPTLHSEAYYNTKYGTGSGGGANPSATIGLTAVNGSATTFLRSDAAPALSQAITPTWTGLHTHAGGLKTAGNISAPAWGTTGVNLFTAPATYTDNSSPTGIVANSYPNVIGIPTLASTNSTTVTNAASLYIAGVPVAGSGVASITTPRALEVVGSSKINGVAIQAGADAGISGIEISNSLNGIQLSNGTAVHIFDAAGSAGAITMGFNRSYLTNRYFKLNQTINVTGNPKIFEFTPPMTSSNSLLASATTLYVNPTYNITGVTGTAIARGIYYDPIITNLVNTAHRAIETISGDVMLGTTSGSVGIGVAATSAINSSLIMDIISTTKGAALPRMTNTQRDAIATPTEGTFIYSLTDHTYEFYNGTVWKSITTN